MKKRGRFWTFKKARRYARRLGLKSQRQWYKFCKNKKPNFIPANPRIIYKNMGWVSWMDWLNTDNKEGGNRRFKVNDNFFKKWSYDMAYILGFWFADGYIGIKKNVFSIAQHKKDKKILQSILNKMNSNHFLRENGDGIEIVILSKEIVKDILRLGGIPRKSLTVKFPYVPKKYLSDFIRGLWDGDGCVSYNKSIKSYCSSFECASKDFIYKLLDILRENISGLKGNIYSRFFKKGMPISDNRFRKSDGKSYSLCLGTNDTRRLRNFLYKNGGLMLPRKHKKFVLAGDINIAPRNRLFLGFKKARCFVRKMKFNSKKDWQNYCKLGKRPLNIPSNPNCFYKDSGWVSWENWFGTKNKKFLPFKSTRRIVRKLRINSRKKYAEWIRANKNLNIPTAPFLVYKNQWIDWYNWLGKEKTKIETAKT